MTAANLWYWIRDLEGKHVKKFGEPLGLHTIVEEDGHVAQVFDVLIPDCKQRIVLIDLSRGLCELQIRQADALRAKRLSPSDRIVALELVRLDWISDKLDRCAARYGPDAKLVVFAGHPNERTIEKLAVFRSRKQPTTQQPSRVLAQEIASESELDPNRPSRDVLDGFEEVEQPISTIEGPPDAKQEKEPVSTTSRIKGKRARNAAKAARRAVRKLRKAKSEGITLPTQQDKENPDPRISTLASKLLDLAVFVQATHEANQAIPAYVHTNGAASTAYRVLSSPTGSSAFKTKLSNALSPRAWIVESVDGDLIVNLPWDTVPYTFVVSDIRQNKESVIRIVDLDCLFAHPDFPFKSTASRVFANSIIRSDLTQGAKGLVWRTIVENQDLCALIVESQTWVDKARSTKIPLGADVPGPDHETPDSSLSSMHVLNEQYDQYLDRCLEKGVERAWNLEKLVDLFELRTGGSDFSQSLCKKDETNELVAAMTELLLDCDAASADKEQA
ncbi:uncharacterized protein JCM15063_006251 [Sporobolomyces koalae]|uniref:uncharacterized protein n=1 Tax=Sporobolomyces koalae TaxID=500713 RepID=UPI003174C3EC